MMLRRSPRALVMSQLVLKTPTHVNPLVATFGVNGVNVFAWMECMSEAFARDCQVNVWMDETSLPAAEKSREWRVNQWDIRPWTEKSEWWPLRSTQNSIVKSLEQNLPIAKGHRARSSCLPPLFLAFLCMSVFQGKHRKRNLEAPNWKWSPAGESQDHLSTPQPPSLLILLSEPGSERKVLTKETWFSLLRGWKSWKLRWEQFLAQPGSP